MRRFRKTRSLLLAVTALTMITTPGLSQSQSSTVDNVQGIINPGSGQRPDATARIGITTSVGQALEDPVAASPTEFSTVGDNLGNHTAIEDLSLNGNDLILEGGDVLSGGGRVLGIAETPTQNSEATSKFYVDGLRSDLTEAITVVEEDVQTLFERRINTPLNQGLTGGGPLSSDLTLTVDGTVVRTSGNQVVSGLKTFSGSVSLANGRLLDVATPVELSDGVNKDYVDQLGETLGGEIDDLTQTFLNRRIDTGAGLLGGGDLSQDRVLRFDTSWGDSRYALRDRDLIAGDGLSGGGNLGQDRTFSVDGSVVRTSGNQMIGGNKTFTGLLAFSDGRLTSVGTPVVSSDAATKGYVDGLTDQIGQDIDTLLARRINTGTGLSGGGDLTADRTLVFDTSWGDARYALRSRALTAGDGLTGGGSLAANRTFDVDGTVVRTSGDQLISGLKTFRDVDGTFFQREGGQDGVLLRGRPGGSSNYAVTLAPSTLSGNRTVTLANGDTTLVPGTMVATSRSIIAGDGLEGGGTLSADRTLTVDGTVVRTGRSVLAGTGLSGGGTLASNRTLSFDAAWGDARYATLSTTQTITGAKTFTASPFFSGQRLRGVAAPIQGTDAVNKAYLEAFETDLNTDLADLTARRIDTGTGLSGGGDLSADRTLVFDTAWGDTRYALRSRTLTAGDGLSGGGNLAANMNFSVDGTVVRTSGDQTVTGLKTFVEQDGTLFRSSAGQDGLLLRGRPGGSGNYAVTITSDSLTGNRTLTLANGNTTLVPGTMVATSRSVVAGDGLSGGGTLSADRTLTVDGTVVRTTRSVLAGTGLSGGGALSTNRTLSFDATWGDARYATLSTAQTISGAKTFTSSPFFSGQRLRGVAAPVQGTDAVNRDYLDSVIGTAGSSYSAGTGLTLSGDTFSITSIAAGNGTIGALRYNGNSQSSGQLYGGTANPTATTRLNYDGSLYATRFYANQYFYFSDETLKENVSRIEGDEGMGIIRTVRPVRYDWRENGREALGVIAQETAEILPNLVDTNEAGLMSVDYIQLIAPMIAAVQDLDARVAELEAQRD